MKKIRLIFLVALFGQTILSAQSRLLDPFDSTTAWLPFASDGVTVDTSIVAGYSGNCIKINFAFTTGAGYCGIRKRFPLSLPANYQFTFYIRAEAPVNNFEFKLLDRSGDNVWWVNQRNFEFPRHWTKITIKKRHIAFAWGPTEDRNLTSVDKIEFVVASATGGRGSVYLDQFEFEPLEIPAERYPQPTASASSIRAKNRIEHIFDGDQNTKWRSKIQPEHQTVTIDLQKYREYGGLVIDWDRLDFAQQYRVQISNDQKGWETIYSVQQGKGGRSYVYLKDGESKYIRLELLRSSRGQGYAIAELAVKDFQFSESPNAFFSQIARDQRRGFYPRYFYDEASYWTIVGVASDTREALINEAGMVEVDKSSFSIEPFIESGDQLITWQDVQLSQSLENDYLPIPSVHWNHPQFRLTITAFAEGRPDSSLLFLIYQLKNLDSIPKPGHFYLALRPFQVNPPYQFLNTLGGAAKIGSLRRDGNDVVVNENKRVMAIGWPAQFMALEFDQGDVVEYLSPGRLIEQTSVNDHFGYASGVLVYPFLLRPAAELKIYLAVPFHRFYPEELRSIDPAHVDQYVVDRLQAVKSFWIEKLTKVQFQLPPSTAKMINTLRSNLGYILINRDGAGIQPGSRSYERSWIRDGAMTSAALLKMGLTEEVRQFFDWYSGYQFADGKIPCVVDRRGPDPVPEHDSHGEFIFGLLNYFRFSGDTAFLRAKFDHIKKAVDYIEYLVGQRRTAYYKNGNDSLRAFYGILPESISHEGYSAKPMHSYWDNFWALKGLKDAVTIAQILKDDQAMKRFIILRDEFNKNLYQSLSLAIKNHSIDYIPGCAELGDFDATSTSIAIYPCNELKNLPHPHLANTFEKYNQHFQQRLRSDFHWENYTPYELRTISTYLHLGQKERAHDMLKFFFADQRPQGWNHWAEVVWKDPRTPRFIGDMPHTWVGSDYINAVRSLFIYEDEADGSLVVGAGLKDEWVDAPAGLAVNHLPTIYGELNYSIQKTGTNYRVNLMGNVKMPPVKIRIKNFKDIQPQKVLINGQPSLDLNLLEIVVKEFPAVVEIRY